MSDHLSDRHLIAAYRESRAPGHFEILVRRHRKSTLRLVLAVLGPEYQADAEDVVQLVYVRVHDRLSSFGRRSRFTTWLYRLTYNLTLDYKRTLARRRRILQEADPALFQHPIDDVAGPSDTDAQAVRQLMLQLPDPYQTALRLHYWFGLSVAEIATTMAIPLGTAKSHLQRGRRRFHRLLERKGVI